MNTYKRPDDLNTSTSQNSKSEFINPKQEEHIQSATPTVNSQQLTVEPTKQNTQNHHNQGNTDYGKRITDNLKIIPLGGVEEIGINSTAYEYKGDIVVVDLGMGFSEYGYYGIDAVVPNVEYLIQKKNKIKGLVITHGHLDHIGALPYLIEMIGFPHLYGTKFTIELIKAKFEEKGFLNQMGDKLHIIDSNSKINLGNFFIKFFHVNHSIPQCVGLYIKTTAGNVVQTGDFKFDNSPIREPVADYARIAEYGQEGVDVLLSDSTNSLKKGHPISESDVARNLEDIVEKANGRIIVATFSGLVGRLYQLLEIAKKTGRKVAIAGYSMNQTLRIAQEIGFIKVDSSLIIPIQNINRHAPNKVMILTTGAQGETDAALNKMAVEDYKGFQLKKGDTVILSAKTITGNDRAVQNMIDSITQRGAIIQQNDDMDLFTSGHGYQEDQKIMLNLVKPKFFMPVHGYQYFLRAHGETAKSVGIKDENVIIAQRGSIVEGNKFDGFKVVKKFLCEPWLVSGLGVGDIGTAVLKEREQLANYGVVVINISLNSKRQLEKEPFIVSRGFVFVKDNLELMKTIGRRVAEVIDGLKDRDPQNIRENVTAEISKFIVQETGREPMIVTVINY